MKNNKLQSKISSLLYSAIVFGMASVTAYACYCPLNQGRCNPVDQTPELSNGCIEFIYEDVNSELCTTDCGTQETVENCTNVVFKSTCMQTLYFITENGCWGPEDKPFENGEGFWCTKAELSGNVCNEAQ